MLIRQTSRHGRSLRSGARLNGRALAALASSAVVGLLALGNQPSTAIPISGTGPTSGSSATGAGVGPQRPGAVPATSRAVNGEQLAEDGGPHRPTGGGGAMHSGGQTSHR